MKPSLSGISVASRLRRVQLGVTLVELMVAMTLSLAIVAAVGYVYLQGKQGFAVQDGQSRLQEDARLAFSTLSRDILMAGYFGCVKAYDPKPTAEYTNLRITAAQPIATADIGWLEKDGDQTSGGRFLDVNKVVRGYDAGANWPVPSTLAAKRFDNTDTLVLLRGGEDARHLSEAVNPATGDVVKVASAITGVGAGDTRLMVISNCTSGEIFKGAVVGGGLTFNVDPADNKNISATVADPVNDGSLRGADSTGYSELAMITTFEPVTYYVALGKGANGNQVPTLYRMGLQTTDSLGTNGLWSTNGGNAVIQGVESFTIRYLIDGAAPGTSLGPFTAADVTAKSAWATLVALVVNVTLVSDADNLNTVTSTRTINGVSVTDTRARYQTSFTVNLRNRRI